MTEPPVCGRTLDGIECVETGAHFCVPRADHVCRFFSELLLHTKGTYARRRFNLADWQANEIVRPLFGETVWSEEHQAYRRRYEVAWIEIARKALAIDTPLLTANRGWITMGEAKVGDQVYTLDGSTTTVNWVSPVFAEERFEVRSRFGRSLIAGADHDWAVLDKRYPRGARRNVRSDGHRTKPEYARRILSTADMTAEGLKWRTGYRFALPDHAALKGIDVDLLVDPYALGAWLGDGTSKSGAITAHEDDQPFMRAQFEAAGYETRATNASQVFYVQKLMTDLRKLGVLHNKHVPASYLEADEASRLALLQGLLDTDGWCSQKGNSLVAGFCSKSEQIAQSVVFLARSLGYQPHQSIKKRTVFNGKEYGPFFEVFWTLRDDLPIPFRMPRKADKRRAGDYRPQVDAIVSVEPVGVGETRCIGVEHPDHVFLAGRDLMPTSNCGKTELLAGIMLYILLAEGEYSAELYGIAKDRRQASLCFDVAAQMVQLNPVLSKRCHVIKSTKRIIKRDSNSVYQVIASDAGAALGSNPSAVAADEILAWPNGEMWDAMRTGMGSKARLQPLLIAATTAGSDSESFGGQQHEEMLKVAQDPSRSPHTFVFMRNTPRDADPFDEKNWYYANPALGDFLSLEAMRKMALEAKNSPARLNSFRQLQLNQWTTSKVAWIPMHEFDECKGTVFETAKDAREAFTGRECWIGLDLAARTDLCAMAYLFPDGDSIDLLWRFWIPEAGFEKLNAANKYRMKPWTEAGWLQVTEGEVLDFERVYADIEADSLRFRILGGDADKWSSDPVIQEIERRTYVDQIFAYDNKFGTMSDGMHRLFEMVKTRTMRWHGNPVARFCFDSTEARIAPYDPEIIRPDKPNRQKVARRIDAVPAAIMAVNAWYTRGNQQMSVYANEEVLAL